ncbi:hypothetical protein [Meiothermus sp.]|uniref:hypothetical protein n=1 Tax=Meiothermus sp. TaxID=1955249 RepID=UPI0026110F49|nr:hypothetical protein [Meiothermus sp.]
MEALEAELERFRAQYRPEELAALEQKQHQIPLLKSKEASLKRYGGSLRLYHERPLPFEEERLDALRDAERLFGELEQSPHQSSAGPRAPAKCYPRAAKGTGFHRGAAGGNPDPQRNRPEGQSQA